MKIHVCEKLEQGKYHAYDSVGKHYNLRVLETINRKPFNKGFVGNFVPHWVRYKTKKYLVHGGIDYAYMHPVDDKGFYIVIN